MKRFYFLVIVFSFIGEGCFSTNYFVSDFKNKQNFYKNFNDFTKNKKIELTYNDETTLTTKEGPQIFDDSLLFESTKIKTVERKVPLSDIRNIDYSSFNYKDAFIILQNGKRLKAANIKTLLDSLSFTEIESLSLTNKVPVDIIKHASYKNRWLGIPSGIGLGIAAATVLILTRVIPAYEEHGMPISKREYNYGNALFVGIPVGVILGAITGWIIGYDFNYHFN